VHRPWRYLGGGFDAHGNSRRYLRLVSVITIHSGLTNRGEV
jgi:hypothetical protein